jgi:predicted dehydrogenase
LNNDKPEIIDCSDNGGYDEEFLDFYSAIVNRTKLKSPFLEGYKDMQVILAALTSANTKKVVHLK